MPTDTAQLDALREQHEAKKLQCEIAQMSHALQLSESVSNLIDPMWQFMDDQGRPTVPAGYLSDRHDGANDPTFRSEEELRSIRGMARVIADGNAYISGALANLTNYVIGTGYEYSASAKRGFETGADELVKAVQAAIDEFCEENAWDEWERELFRRSRRDGEFFLRCTPIGGGHTQVRTIEPEQVTEQGQHPLYDDMDREPMSWSFGIHTPERDVMDVRGYSVIWDFESSADYVPDEEIVHAKVNVDRNVKRGLSDLYPVGDDFEGARKLMRNARDGAAIQAAIAFLKRYPPGTQKSTVANQIDGTTDWTKSRFSKVSGRQTEDVRHYSSGTVLGVSNGLEYVEGPLASGAANFMEVLQGALRACAVRWSMPEAMISGDASNANYASSLVAEAPFTKAIEAGQWFYCNRYRNIMWKVIGIAASAGRFRRFGVGFHELRRIVELTITPPPAEARDKTLETTRRQSLNASGVMSRKTWSAMEDLDYDVEQENLSHESTAKPAAPGDGGVPTAPRPLPPELAEAVATVNESMGDARRMWEEVYP